MKVMNIEDFTEEEQRRISEIEEERDNLFYKIRKLEWLDYHNDDLEESDEELFIFLGESFDNIVYDKRQELIYLHDELYDEMLKIGYYVEEDYVGY